MWPVFPWSSTLAVLLVLAGVAIGVARLQSSRVTDNHVLRGFAIAFAVVAVGLAAWAVGRLRGDLAWVHAGAGTAYAAILVTAPAVAWFPMGALLHRLIVRPTKGGGKGGLGRRELLRGAISALPAAAASGVCADGLVRADDPPRLRAVPMRYADLHPDLEGLRILQISDAHLGACLDLAAFERFVRSCFAEGAADLVALTGDLADDPALLAPALAVVRSLNARYGAYASLGNHEYLRGIEETRPLYEASGLPLLVGRGMTVAVGRAKLFVAGADDPVHMRGDLAAMLTPSIERALADASPEADFRLLLCHRPEGFGPAAERGVDLVLAGHTHGGQLGLFGRSLLAWLWPDVAWWGTYARGGSRLYTTSGFGHWFPFRVGCPTEAALVVLERGEVATRQA